MLILIDISDLYSYESFN